MEHKKEVADVSSFVDEQKYPPCDFCDDGCLPCAFYDFEKDDFVEGEKCTCGSGKDFVGNGYK
ncbi:MAG: hypothetical protein COU90_02590 [Candidatus Ryanbacteria bacterium CG10_big_fil_rev_8_21_14_0_10_43_42]|uniref:Uncharacterized protein n=1 Tax=Candidatus Ryanbacteria bacterium CG10_big_fil_rev_8_21_14_0_10_43_42 TaxID=1974864 RepID=A0A2M8KWK7_9BACT|nr:MAG: hypothetical protein COU90_02590 [Candidatus Ryanbacteria bacterium CG10_big_fil_rev_8_21_14_0_10_43_42]